MFSLQQHQNCYNAIMQAIVILINFLSNADILSWVERIQFSYNTQVRIYPGHHDNHSYNAWSFSVCVVDIPGKMSII